MKPGGYLVFETRDPSNKDWLNWTKNKTYKRIKIPDIGFVEGWCEVFDTVGDLVRFRWTYIFESDGEVIVSNSTLRFRSKNEIRKSLVSAGFEIAEIRSAPDRPKKEFVVITRKISSV